MAIGWIIFWVIVALIAFDIFFSDPNLGLGCLGLLAVGFIIWLGLWYAWNNWVFPPKMNSMVISKETGKIDDKGYKKILIRASKGETKEAKRAKVMQSELKKLELELAPLRAKVIAINQKRDLKIKKLLMEINQIKRQIRQTQDCAELEKEPTLIIIRENLSKFKKKWK